jgi:NAD(P)H-flavin reductase
MYEILEKEILNPNIEKMELKAPYIAKKCRAGQFLMIMVEEDGERIPLTIADYDRKKESVTIVYQIVGYTTKLLSKKNKGEYLFAVSGPMGKAVEHINGKRILGIGGGVGAAPLLPQIKEYFELGIECDVILGARNSEYIILQDEFRKYASNIYICTDDGSYGNKGFVTDVLKELIEKGNNFEEVIAIGPIPMMKAVVEITKKINIKTSVSLNPIMIDGTGMCGGCRLTYDGKTKFACVDGPDFDGFKVDFDELMSRSDMYKEHEEKHVCKLEEGGNNNE